MAYDNNGYGGSDEQRYGASSRRRGASSSGTQSPPTSAPYTPTPTPAPYTPTPTPSTRTRQDRTGKSDSGSNPDTSVAPRQRYSPVVQEKPKKKLFPGRDKPQGENLVSKTASVSVRGRVVSMHRRQRRNDFFHVLFDTLFGGAPMTFDPHLQVMTVDLNDQDHTRIDTRGNKSVVVNLVGQMYDGAIDVHDTVEVTGHWTKNGTINATRIFNHTNCSKISMSHAVPAVVVRVAAILLLVGIAMLFLVPLFQGKDLGQAFGNFLLKLLPFLLVGLLLIWCLSRPRGRGMMFLRRAFRWIIFWVVLIVVVLLLWRFAPDMLYLLLTMVLCIWGIRLMIKAVFR